ncbi:hypothetical protein Micbo1qcDRAFT_43616 [Microdochium bolleyi]|uniref:Uncharacterized protein n=1 Tax=Microdochium bolleyi TaxID=196109 RepID=A0A136JB34_9PEZI|nr:hypothetical protein Micbo1qcDRAFT_43616 [Microdochium bolleyi]
MASESLFSPRVAGGRGDDDCVAAARGQDLKECSSSIALCRREWAGERLWMQAVGGEVLGGQDTPEVGLWAIGDLDGRQGSFKVKSRYHSDRGGGEAGATGPGKREKCGLEKAPTAAGAEYRRLGGWEGRGGCRVRTDLAEGRASRRAPRREWWRQVGGPPFATTDGASSACSRAGEGRRNGRSACAVACARL